MAEQSCDTDVTFETYAVEFSSLLQAAKEIGDLDECASLLKQMTLEARGLDPKEVYLDRCKAYKSKLQVKKVELERSVLMSDKTNSGTTNETPVESKLAQQNIVLNNAMQSIHRTEDTAGDIAANLNSQRETIESTRRNTKTLESLTTKASQIADNLLKPWWKKAMS